MKAASFFYRFFYITLIPGTLFAESKNISAPSALSNTELQAQLNLLLEKRINFIKAHDQEKKLPALEALHKKLKNCQNNQTTVENKACKELQREFGILTMSYFRSLSESEKETLYEFAKSFHELTDKALKQQIVLTKQDFPFDLLFI